MSKNTKRILFLAAAVAACVAAYSGFVHRRSLFGGRAKALGSTFASLLEMGRQLRVK